jgi:hypothetical protein
MGKQKMIKPRSGDRRRSLSPVPGSTVFYRLILGLLTAFGRRDAPSPASGRWPEIAGLGHESLPSAG